MGGERDLQRVASRVEETGGYCWRIYCKVLEVPFLGGNFLSFFAFQDGMCGTQFSALLSSPTVSGRFLKGVRDRAARGEQGPGCVAAGVHWGVQCRDRQAREVGEERG
jgi:hypothetical protein